MSTPSIDPYEVLKIAKEAQISEIRSAHRRLVLTCHPDKVQDPKLKAQKQDEFQRVQQAYEILSDENQRQKYDDKVRLAELRHQYQNRANASAPRSSPQVFEVRTVDPSTRGGPPNVKVHTSYSARPYEDDRRDDRRSRSYYESDIRLPRRENTAPEKPPKSDRDRKDDKEKEKRRTARRDREAVEEQRRAEKAAKEKEKKRQEKQRTKDAKRSKEDKRERTDPYIEPFDDGPRRRERSRGETPPRGVSLDDEPPYNRYNFAKAYISRSRTDVGPDRGTYSYRFQEPIPQAVPTPPQPGAPFTPPSDDEDNRRSSARPRRGSGADLPSVSRDRSYRKPSVEPYDEPRNPRDPNIVNASPAARKASRHVDPVYGSPPRNLHRTNTAPMPSSSRAVPQRSQTYNGPMEPEYASGNRGRYRSKKQAQVEESSEDEDDFNPPPRRSKHRSSRKTRSPEGGAEIRYHVNEGRTTKIPAQSFTRQLHAEPDYYYDPAPPRRPSYPAREASYASTGNYKVKTGKSYGYQDIQYTHYDPTRYYEGISTQG